jgi:hypothetical protein
MKSFFSLSIGLLMSHSAFSAEIYCRYDDSFVKMSSDNAYLCAEYFAEPEVSSNAVCFTGKRDEVIELINNFENREVFGGTDGLSVNSPNFYGPQNISYIVVDAANEESYKNVISRCTRSFFSN